MASSSKMSLNGPVLSVICTLLLGAVDGGVVTPLLGRGETIHASTKVFGPYSWDEDWAKNPWLELDSPVPVSVLRYYDNKYMVDETPLRENEVHIVVKSAGCTEDEIDSIVASIDARGPAEAWNENAADFIKISVDVGENPVVFTEFPEPATTYQATWSYTSFWCQSFQEEDGIAPTCPPTPEKPSDGEGEDEDLSISRSSSMLTNEAPKTKNAADESSAKPRRANSVTFLAFLMGSCLYILQVDPRRGQHLMAISFVALLMSVVLVSGANHNRSNNTDTNASSPLAENQEELALSCRVGVEILFDTCSQAVYIRAPLVRVLDVVPENEGSKCDPTNACRTNYRTELTFPSNSSVFPVNFTDLGEEDGNFDSHGRKELFIPTLDELVGWDSCARMMEGRPFVDSSGSHLQASAVSEEVGRRNSWGSMTEELDLPGKLSKEHQQTLKGLEKEWTRRALGEHASIASFAAFSMALLSNQAPPDLVQDSLTAAMDEVRHAKVSFEMASLLRRTVVGGETKLVAPGPLPPSGHNFGRNITALAVGAAEEGCIDETLSAFSAAAEASYYSEKKGQELGNLFSILQQKMETIAMEEGRHSILAWRTVHWACLANQSACSAVKVSLEAIAAPAILQKLRTSHFPLDENLLRAEWKRVLEALAPVATGQRLAAPDNPADCSFYYDSNWKQSLGREGNKALVTILADSIIGGVYCYLSPLPTHSNAQVEK